jgi:hypothetical protein
MPLVLPWDELFNGEIWVLDPDDDLRKRSIPRMKTLLRQKARERGMKIRAEISTAAHVEAGQLEKAGMLVIQAYPASKEEIAEWARKHAAKEKEALQAAEIDEEYERAMTEFQEEELRRARPPQRVHEYPIRDWDFD